MVDFGTSVLITWHFGFDISGFGIIDIHIWKTTYSVYIGRGKRYK